MTGRLGETPLRTDGAVIIPFPVALCPTPASDVATPVPTRVAPPEQDGPAPETPSERLRRALIGLDSALVEQRTAIAEWQRTVVALKGSVAGLGQSLEHYQDRLSRIGRLNT